MPTQPEQGQVDPLDAHERRRQPAQAVCQKIRAQQLRRNRLSPTP